MTDRNTRRLTGTEEGTLEDKKTDWKTIILTGRQEGTLEDRKT